MTREWYERYRAERAEDSKSLATSGSLVHTGFLGSGGSANVFSLDRNGQQFTFTISQVGLDAKIGRAITQSLRIIENRINSSGVTEPTIQQQGKDRIVVQMPGIGNPDEVVKLLGQTANHHSRWSAKPNRRDRTNSRHRIARLFP